MKNIELTKKHKSKLLEICKTLFPEYTEIYFGVNDYDCKFDGYIYFQKTVPLISNIINEIHWFEFCMTHLKDKLQDELEKVNKLDYDYQMKTYDSWWESHPVDYLYKEFKKLK